jgi:hypothetical protein
MLAGSWEALAGDLDVKETLDNPAILRENFHVIADVN